MALQQLRAPLQDGLFQVGAAWLEAAGRDPQKGSRPARFAASPAGKIGLSLSCGDFAAACPPCPYAACGAAWIRFIVLSEGLAGGCCAVENIQKSRPVCFAETECVCSSEAPGREKVKKRAADSAARCARVETVVQRGYWAWRSKVPSNEPVTLYPASLVRSKVRV